MKSNSVVGSLVLTVLLVFCLLLIAGETLAASELETLPTDGKIEVVYPSEKLAPYRERRETWSTVFSINVDQFYPDKFRSRLQQGGVEDAPYDTLFGSSPITLTQVQLGAKYNFGLGALGTALIVGMGTIKDQRTGRTMGTFAGESHELTIFKKGATVQFAMDNLFPEPYVVPYIEGQLFKIDYRERRSAPGVESDIAENSGTTDFATAVVLGALIQLNGLEKEAALMAQETSGMDNIFLDIFASQYNTSSDETDPSFETSINYGAGLRFEF